MKCRLCNKFTFHPICGRCAKIAEDSIYEYETHNTLTKTGNNNLDWFIVETIKAREEDQLLR